MLIISFCKTMANYIAIIGSEDVMFNFAHNSLEISATKPQSSLTESPFFDKKKHKPMEDTFNNSCIAVHVGSNA